MVAEALHRRNVAEVNAVDVQSRFELGKVMLLYSRSDHLLGEGEGKITLKANERTQRNQKIKYNKTGVITENSDLLLQSAPPRRSEIES